MKRNLLFLAFGLLISLSSFSQDCFLKLQKAFDDRGANPVANDMHRNVILSFFEESGSTYCLSGKARVENGVVTGVFLMYDDGTYELMQAKFYNSNKEAPKIVNGITEMIFNSDNEKFKIIFIDTLKPKKKGYKSFELPEDL